MTQHSDQTQGRVMAFFEREARRFPIVLEQDASWLRRLSNAVFRRSLRLRYRRVMEECVNPEQSRILDIGCGPGTYSIALAHKGAQSVVGIDFASKMIEIARQRAAQSGVGEQCRFIVTSLDDFHAGAAYDYVIAIGVMDYAEHAEPFIGKVASITATKAIFSFPKGRGFLAWQRRLRYRRRCPLFMYTREDLDRLFGPVGGFTYTVESIARDWLVILRKNPDG